MKPISTTLVRHTTLWCCAALVGLHFAASAATLTNRYSFTADASDSVGGKNGTLVNATISGNQVQLAAPGGTPSNDTVNGQYVDLPDDMFTNFTAITIETWATPSHQDVAGGEWARLWDFGNLSGTAGTHSFWFRTGNSSQPVRGDIFYPGNGDLLVGNIIPTLTEAHIVWTTDGTSQRGRLYVNGVLVGFNNSFDSTPALMGSTTNNWLGRSQFSADFFWDGSINEFRVYDGVVNPLEAAADFQAGPDTIGASPGTVTNLQLQPFTTIAVNAGVQAVVLAGADGLTNNSIDIADSEIAINYTSANTNIATVTARGQVTGKAAGTVNIIAAIGSISSTQAIQVIAVPTAMKHRYSFTTDATDSFGTANGWIMGDATVSGGQVMLTGNPGSYVDLDPNGASSGNSYIIHPTNIVNGAVTFETWATMYQVNGAWTRLFDFGNISGTVGQLYFFLTPNTAANGGQARVAVADGGGENNFSTGNLLGRTNVHVAVVYNPNPARQFLGMYINGNLVGSTTTSKTLASLNNRYSYLGRSLFSADSWLAGSIDEFRIYDGELTRFQLAASYQSGPNNPNFDPGTFVSIQVGAGSTPTMPVDQLRQASVAINFTAATNINLLGDAQLTLTSSDTNVATISSPAGVITSRSLGSTTITASYNYIVGATTNTYSANFVLTTYIPSATLVHRYTFNEGGGSVVNDIVGTANGQLAAGTNELGVTNATWAGGQLIINTNTTLGAQDAYVDLPTGIISSLVSNVTLESWATVTASTDWQRVWDFGSQPSSPTNAAAPDIFLTSGPGGTDNPRYDWVNGNINSSVTWTPGTQAHIVVTHSGTDGSAQMYLNGALVASSSTQTLPLSSIDDTNCFFGRSIYTWPYSLPGGYFDPYMVGSLNEIRIYKGLLTAAEVAQQYAIGPDQIIANVPLSATASGGNLTFSWPTYGAHFALETTTSLSSPSWGPAGGTLSQSASNYQQTVPIGPGSAFFRLKR